MMGGFFMEAHVGLRFRIQEVSFHEAAYSSVQYDVSGAWIVLIVKYKRSLDDCCVQYPVSFLA